MSIEMREEYLSKYWRVVRARGRSRFVWRDRVLSVGVPTLSLLTVWRFLRLNVGLDDFFLARAPLYWVLQIGLMVSIAYVLGRVEWHARERQFRDLWLSRGLDVPGVRDED